MNDNHLVIEAKRMNDGTWGYRAVTPELGWREAQTVWGELDDKRLRGSVGDRILRGDRMHEHFFMVRSAQDPRWANLVRPTVRRGWDGRRNAAKDYGKANGISGAVGGWLYNASGANCGQGWDQLGVRLAFRKAIRPISPYGSSSPKSVGWYNAETEFVPEPVAVAS